MTRSSAIELQTVVVEGSVAPGMRRADAARANECGIQILGLPQLAARLAGGFAIPVTAQLLDPAVRRALDEGGFVELEPGSSCLGLPVRSHGRYASSGMPTSILDGELTALELENCC
ncbi:hypothetical protein AAFG22_05090 [Bradyrhizobium sp. B024]|uniref:hypothetical protein n=1 Tax=Bradyrhizobium sp. B024 TaxID=3140247 RepID=UPI00318392CE